ncbi:PDZ domain-containing protein [Nocardia sp. SYP-A9097]|uniref:PDZ domain-containing protein n=1 Tax=Nocardia sp. SYP-A9097 TaxID=2663237 RepID=UPI001E29739E|nr:PDZ domain-containing protein [Nocardia sp. SYP-A9097]
MRQAVGLPPIPGLLVREITPGSPAEKAGIRTGDVLTEANGHHLRSIDALHIALSTDTPLRISLTRGVDENHTLPIDPTPNDSDKNPLRLRSSREST